MICLMSLGCLTLHPPHLYASTFFISLLKLLSVDIVIGDETIHAPNSAGLARRLICTHSAGCP